MRVRALLVCLLVATTAIPSPVAAQGSSTVELDLTLRLEPDSGQVEVTFQVADPGSLRTIQLGMGDLESLEGSPTYDGAWSQEDGTAVADLEETPNARAKWTSDGRIRAQTLEGEGHTTYVSWDFAVIKAGDMVPSIRYSFPEGSAPTFATSLTVETPEGWTVKGPWPTDGKAFQLDRALPRGFVAAGPNVEEAQLGSGDDAYRMVRVAGAEEDTTTESILLEARSYLGGIWGRTAHEQFIVVAPDPMFRGGLGSPAGVFIHGDADAKVVAHEMVHAYQGFRFSRAPGEATVWLGEGTAVVHGALLEVAAGISSRQETRSFLEDRAEKAENEHAVDLTTAIYGSGNEQAAYTKGAVVVTALDDHIREETGNQYTLADVLKDLNRQGRQADSFTASTADIVDAIANMTGHDPQDFFDRYVYDSNVPPLGSIFPGQASVRILGTDPDPPVAGQPFDLTVQLTNLDTRETTVDAPVKVDGEERGRLVATLDSGATARADAEVEALDRGTYTIEVESASAEITVPSPAEPSANVTIWPRQPTEDRNVTVGARIANAGEAPYRDQVSILVDGQAVVERRVDVAPSDVNTLSATLPPLSLGAHDVRVVGQDGGELATSTFSVSQQPEPVHAAGPGLVLTAVLMLLAARLVRARARR